MTLSNPPSEWYPALHDMADRLQCSPIDLASVWMNESACTPEAHNAHGDASGLCQMMPETLRLLGFRPDLPPPERAGAFRDLGYMGQMPWVEKYYAPARGRLGNATRCYLWTFLPALIGHGDELDYVLAARDSDRTGYIYKANSGFDADGDLVITVRELGQAIDRACAHSSRWAMIQRGLTGFSAAPAPLVADLGTWRGIQIALERAGMLSANDIDGIVGPVTLRALRQFQALHALQVDGQPGPKTRAALQAVTEAA